MLMVFVALPIRGSAVDSQTIAEHLSGAVRIPTISHADPSEFDGQAFRELAAYLRETYPLVHRQLEVETIADYSLLWTWPGTNPDLEGALFMSHLDVVPIDASTASEWTHPPFSGAIRDGFVWGRGALDAKCGVILWLEAVEALLAEGVVPERTIYLAFGHDEELGGQVGAATIARTLEERGVRLAFVFDEGGNISPENPLVPGGVTAMVFVAEKTFLTLRLTAHGRGGHSSTPPRHTSIGKLASAIHRLEANPMPARMTEPVRAMLETAAPYQTSFMNRFAMGNLWLTEGAVIDSMSEDDVQSSMVRTTMATTVVRGGVKPNVIPESASAWINFRLLPGDSTETVVAHVRAAIADPEIEIEASSWSDAAPPADVDGPGYVLIREASREVLPDVVVVPSLMPGATDTRHYARIAEDVYRFVPVHVDPELMEGFHGRDERIAIEDLDAALDIAIGMVRRSAQPGR
jgi:carboxypeptidase PM20D1